MRDEAAVEVRCEHMVRKHVLPAIVQYGSISLAERTRRQVGRRFVLASSSFQPSILHLVPGTLPCPSQAAKKSLTLCPGSQRFSSLRDVTLTLWPDESYPYEAVSGTRISHEQIIERTVLLHDEDHVLDRRR